MRIANKNIGPGNPCFIIAEASSNHGRDLLRAKKMVDVAADAGADAVKFQVFTAEKIAADTTDPRTIVRADEKSVFVDTDTKLIDLYRKNELPREWIVELAAYAKERGIIFLATPFDDDAVDQLEAVNVPAYKIASYELLDVPLLRKVAATKKPVILSTGMATLADMEYALRIMEQAGNSEVIFLHCSSTYPTPPENISLNAIQTMRQAFPRCPIGYSDHSMGISIPIAAAALGACVIEKHFMLDDGVQTVDAKFSLSLSELKTMVESIRMVEKALGSTEKQPSNIEEKEKIQARRSLWVVRDVKKNEALTALNLKSLRPGIGLSPIHYDIVLGKRASRPLKAGHALEWEDLFLN